MRLTEPKVYLIGRPEIDWYRLQQYLSSIGVSDHGWDQLRGPDHDPHADDAQGEGQTLTEVAGRLCYRSWEVNEKLNPNVTKVRTNKADYFENILSSGHGSVLEHATYNFILQDVSRVFTHEIVRHRVGTAISQESLRYVRLTDLPFWIPAWAQADRDFMRSAETLLEAMEAFQMWMAQHFQLDSCMTCGWHAGHFLHDGVAQEGYTEQKQHPFKSMPFDKKKRITSFMRRFSPQGLTTSMVWSANLRTLRHVIEMRTSVSAEEEMLAIVPQIAKIMQQEAPLLFKDYVEQEDGSWQTPYRKV